MGYTLPVDLSFGLWLALSGLLLVLMALSNRRERIWDRKWKERRADRFKLKVHVVGPEDRSISLGTSVVGGRRAAGSAFVTYDTIEEGLKETATLSSPRLHVQTEDGAQLIIQEHTKLVAPAPRWAFRADVTRAQVENLEPHVSDEGTRYPRARYDYCVPGGTEFWILDAPPMKGQTATYRDAETEIPPKGGGYDISFMGPPDPENSSTDVIYWPYLVLGIVFLVALPLILLGSTWSVGFHVVFGIALLVVSGRLLMHHWEASMTKEMAEGDSEVLDISAHLELPLFLHGMKSPDWVMPRKVDDFSVVCLDLVKINPQLMSNEQRVMSRAACLLMTEAVMLQSDVKAVSSIHIDPGRSVRELDAPLTWNSMPKSVRSLVGRHLVIWGESVAGPEGNFATLHIKATEGEPRNSISFEGALPEVLETVLLHLDEQSYLHLETPRASDFKRFGGGAAMGPYASALGSVLQQILAGNEAIQPVSDDAHRAALDETRQLHDATGSLQTALLYLTSSIYAFRAQALPQDHRDHAMVLIATAESGTVLSRLSPVIRVALETTTG